MARYDPSLMDEMEQPKSCPSLEQPGNVILTKQDLEEEYIHQLRKRDAIQLKKDISEKEAINFVLIDDFKGNKIKVKCHN